MLEVVINQSDFDRILRAIDTIENIVIGFRDTIPEESAREFSDEVTKNIISQKFGDFGAPHEKWKKNQPNEEAHWLWLGTSLKSLAAKRLVGSSDVVKWFVGFDYQGGSIAPSVPKNKKDTTKRTSWKERSDAARSTGPVIHISPIGYVSQKKSGGTILGGGA